VPDAPLLAQDRDLLMELLRIPTAGPLETGPDGPSPRLWDAQHMYAQAASPLGFRTVEHLTARREEVVEDDVPLAVRRGVEQIANFLEDQPSLVLRLGPPLPRSDTVMFNVHLDTVSTQEGASFDGITFRGRGAVDAKGPAVALLAGIRAAVAAEPDVGSRVSVLIQAVSGEEGGAMGTIGTRDRKSVV
jgi:acetylornithine deacetylase/succinyl-diaminopimelate desuccinylase-like protein